MGLYGRNDVMSVAVPLTAGGCGAMHSRPVADGVAADEWNLEPVCILCAVALRGDPLWAAMPSEIPETHDERTLREDAEKRGERAVKKSQEKLSVQQGELNEKLVELLSRGTAPVNGPSPEDIASLIQREVAKALLARGVDVPNHPELVQSVPVDGEVDLTRLHVRTLSKMCNDRGLDRRGSKADLIARLTAGPESEAEAAAEPDAEV